MKIYELTQDNFDDAYIQKQANQILKGLGKGEIGIILSMPDMGKGYTCLSLAYELALQKPLLGLYSENNRSSKVLYWPAEDKAVTALNRVSLHFDFFQSDIRDKLAQQVQIVDHPDIGCSQHATKDRKVEVEKHINNFIELAKEYDLVIIDTLREAFGDADEVIDDMSVKNTLQKIALEADVAIVATHHITKAAARGEERISNVSGSGFSRTLANARWQLALHEIKDKKKTIRVMSHVKANNVSQNDRFNDIPYSFTPTSMCITPLNLLSEIVTMSYSDSNDITPPEEMIIDPSVREAYPAEKYNTLNNEEESAYLKWMEKQ